MDLCVLIPESTRKASGGDPYAKNVDGFAEALPSSVRTQLYELRAEIAAKWKNDAASQGLLPAYRRYQGNMYHEIPEDAWAKRKPGVEIVIVSGLYGAVASRDTIFAYPHSMAESTPPFGKLNRWWRDHGLADILAAYLKAAKPKRVIDLLSLEYREAVAGFPAKLPGLAVKEINFPGMGRESQPMRGEKITKILRTGDL